MSEAKSLEVWVLLWSASQCAFHIESVADMLDANRSAFAEDRRMDYVPLAVGTEDHCHAAADALRPTLRDRQQGREQARAVIDAARSK